MTERFLLTAGSILLCATIAITIGIISETALLVASILTYVVILSFMGFMSSCAVYFGIKGEFNKNTTTKNINGENNV
jgi:hypothetical protein